MLKHTLKIAVDIDGTLCEHVNPVLAIINKRYGLTLKHADIKHWNERILNSGIDVRIDAAYRNPKFVQNLPTIRGSKKAMAELAKKHELMIATCRVLWAEKATLKWLAKNFAGFEYINVRSSGKAKLDSDVLIDDFVPNIKGFAENGGVGILFAQPWNQDTTEIDDLIKQGKAYRCTGWAQVVETIKSILPKK